MVIALRTIASVLAVLMVASGAAAEPAGVDASQRVYEDVGGEPHLGRQLYDAVLLRPFGLVQLAAGSASLVPLYPFSLLANRGDDLFRACVADPFERTFRRPLGQL